MANLVESSLLIQEKDDLLYFCSNTSVFLSISGLQKIKNRLNAQWDPLTIFFSTLLSSLLAYHGRQGAHLINYVCRNGGASRRNYALVELVATSKQTLCKSSHFTVKGANASLWSSRLPAEFHSVAHYINLCYRRYLWPYKKVFIKLKANMQLWRASYRCLETVITPSCRRFKSLGDNALDRRKFGRRGTPMPRWWEFKLVWCFRREIFFLVLSDYQKP